MKRVADTSGQVSGDDDYQRLIGSHFSFIEKRCWQVVQSRRNPSSGHPLKIENEVLELCNRVLDKLKQNDYQILRQFQGKAKLTTYLTAIIANQSVDLIRKYRGRDRQKERAKKLGKLGEQIYQLALVDNLSPEEIHMQVSESGPNKLTVADIDEMIALIRGKRYPGNPEPAPGGAVKEGAAINGNGQPVVVDDKKNPEELMVEHNGHTKVKGVVEGLLHGLSGEERMILRLRFPAREGDSPCSIVEIAETLGISAKATYKKISRLLHRCKKKLEKEGVRFHDFI
jgi:RNA polymerase sigma factor (sigma-70 family)